MHGLYTEMSLIVRAKRVLISMQKEGDFLMQKMKMVSAANMTIEDGYKEFKRYCEVRNYSKYTVKHYDNTVHNFELFRPIDNDIGILNQELIEEYTAYLLKKA